MGCPRAGEVAERVELLVPMDQDFKKGAESGVHLGPRTEGEGMRFERG